MKPVAIGTIHRDDDDDDDQHDDPAATTRRIPHAYTTAAEAVRGVEHVIDMMDSLRKDLGQLYYFAVGGTVVEHELGEALQATRKALARLRKARHEMGEFEQITLPLE